MKNQLATIVKSSNLKDITMDIVEAIIDNNLSEIILKETPVVKLLMAVKNIHSSVSDCIFIKKSMTVLLELRSVSEDDRIKFINDLDDKFDKGIEKLIMIIDKLDQTKKCMIFGRLCRIRASGAISKSGFLRLTKIIQDAYLEDLEDISFFRDHYSCKKCGDDYSALQLLNLLYTNLPGYDGPYSSPDEYTLHMTSLGELLALHYESLFYNIE
jgi:hypothetical protein